MTSPHLTALELAGQGDWNGAHQLIQDFDDNLACMIHGYLHRVEGDTGNAAYWYHRAGETLPVNSLPEEYERLLAIAIKRHY